MLQAALVACRLSALALGYLVVGGIARFETLVVNHVRARGSLLALVLQRGEHRLVHAFTGLLRHRHVVLHFELHHAVRPVLAPHTTQRPSVATRPSLPVGESADTMALAFDPFAGPVEASEGVGMRVPDEARPVLQSVFVDGDLGPSRNQGHTWHHATALASRQLAEVIVGLAKGLPVPVIRESAPVHIHLHADQIAAPPTSGV
mmetsp:Transcript_54604/g.150307  ORF Transcript_54604/g.150307 Transcript_54604/m.150307 type:complete len:204 (-) Transcript_54604:6400-7011(-)